MYVVVHTVPCLSKQEVGKLQNKYSGIAMYGHLWRETEREGAGYTRRKQDTNVHYSETADRKKGKRDIK